MVEYLDAGTILNINAELVGATGINDMHGIDALVGRPMSGFGDYETFPDVWLKAAAYAHGLASTQYFMDGNKRTAWITANMFLAGNGYPLPSMPDIEAEMFINAVALDAWKADDPYATIEKAAEWFRTAWETQRVGPAFDSRVEYAFIAAEGGIDEESTFSVLRGGLNGFTASEFPTSDIEIVFVTRIHWLPQDLDEDHVVSVEILPTTPEGKRVNRGRGEVKTSHPIKGEHSHHRAKIMPFIISTPLNPVFLEAGAYEVHMAIDGEAAACVPLNIHHIATPNWEAFPY